MSANTSVIIWFIKLPFRPVMRWITALVVIVPGLGWWSGYLLTVIPIMKAAFAVIAVQPIKYELF